MEINRAKRMTREVSMIPLINLVFLLLIFFLVAGTIEKFEVIPVDVPVADSGKVLDQGHIVIVIGQYNEILLNDELVDIDELRASVTQLLANNPRKIISLKADSRLEASKMVAIMDLLRVAGGTNLSIVTQSLS
ncbi:MAG: biopolymer transporter ExbD [Rickettsiales bacterium]|nr:biopolymer transporter ExbD [Rickettsiales bacterium]